MISERDMKAALWMLAGLAFTIGLVLGMIAMMILFFAV